MKKSLFSIFLVVIFLLTSVLSAFADTNQTTASQSSTVGSAVYQTTYSQPNETTSVSVYQQTTTSSVYQTTTSSVYQTTSSSVYEVVYPTQQQTTSTVYSTTYNAVYSIPQIKDDAIKIVMGDDEKGITKEQKKQIIALIEKINTLRNRFNKLNAEVNALRAKINKYLNAANNNDRKFFDEDIRKDLKDLSDAIVKLTKDLANKKLSKNELNRIGQALEQAKAKLEKLRKAYQNQNQL